MRIHHVKHFRASENVEKPKAKSKRIEGRGKENCMAKLI